MVSVLIISLESTWKQDENDEKCENIFEIILEGYHGKENFNLLSDNVIIFNAKKKGDEVIMRSFEKEPDEKYQNQKGTPKIWQTTSSFCNFVKKYHFSYLGNLKQTSITSTALVDHSHLFFLFPS